MDAIKNDLKTMKLKRAYLIYGEERYLVSHYARLLEEKLLEGSDRLMNMDVFDGKEAAVESIVNAAETVPFLNAYRLVIVRDSQLFASGRKQDSEKISDYLPKIPESTVIAFVESEVDKRGRLYKKTAELGGAVEYKTPRESELIPWVANVANKRGKSISRDVSLKLLRHSVSGMNALYSEIIKLCDYSGDRDEIHSNDIDLLCSPSIETRIFELTASIAEGKTGDALRKYKNMLDMKESPHMILPMIARQFRLMLSCKSCDESKMRPDEAASLLRTQGFIVNECMRQAKRFTFGRLRSALSDCAATDCKIKSGLLDAETGVEMLIVKYCG